MNYTSYFKFSELFTFGDDADFDEEIVDDNAAQALGVKPKINLEESADEQMEVHSAHGAEDILKMKMYQIE